jgi:hypothetical protein
MYEGMKLHTSLRNKTKASELHILAPLLRLAGHQSQQDVVGKKISLPLQGIKH